MILVVNKYLVPKGFNGLTLYPFVFLKHRNDKTNTVFLNHERIHLRQQSELLILPFYLLYIIEFLIRFVQYRNKNQAYRNISFEREAYANESSIDYIKNRNRFSFLKYLSRSK